MLTQSTREQFPILNQLGATFAKMSALKLNKKLMINLKKVFQITLRLDLPYSKMN
jgi:hypothetical protein